MNNIDKPYIDLVNDFYKNYVTSDEVRWPKSKEDFINTIKTDDAFAKKWGFQVYTRELKHKERIKLAWSVFFPDRKNESVPDWWNVKGLSMDEKNIPTRAISLTYNNQTIEIYE